MDVFDCPKVDASLAFHKLDRVKDDRIEIDAVWDPHSEAGQMYFRLSDGRGWVNLIDPFSRMHQFEVVYHGSLVKPATPTKFGEPVKMPENWKTP